MANRKKSEFLSDVHVLGLFLGFKRKTPRLLGPRVFGSLGDLFVKSVNLLLRRTRYLGDVVLVEIV